MPTTKTFLGYAVFYKGEPFPSSGNTVTKNKLYLKSHALFKLNQLGGHEVREWYLLGAKVDMLWRRNQHLTLRRVYAV